MEDKIPLISLQSVSIYLGLTVIAVVIIRSVMRAPGHLAYLCERDTFVSTAAPLRQDAVTCCRVLRHLSARPCGLQGF